jgi:hypothetical protein
MRAAPLIAVAAILLPAGCVTGGASGPQASAGGSQITREEIETIPPGSAFEAVSTLRLQWLRGHSGSFRSETGRNSPVVFVDGRPFGPMDSLHQIGTESIESIRFLSASDATTRFGTGYPAGIIEVVTRRPPSHPNTTRWMRASWPGLHQNGPSVPPGTHARNV